MKLFTMGFSKKSASTFFGKLEQNEVKRLIDVRLNNKSQLAGFTKGSDLSYFLKRICGIEYEHWLICAPTKEMLTNYQNGLIDWAAYVVEYNELIERRKVFQNIDRTKLNSACLLCSEPTAENCHRRLLAEYFARNMDGLEIEHL